ncbi:MAG TPA: cysteine hydrolase family protein [Segetibacter sp.]|jgi:nicotinamidase-related amidase
MKALLIIDMQKGSFKPYSLRHDTLGTINRINSLSGYFRDNHYPVIFIQHDGTKEKSFFPNSEDWEILPELVRLPNDITISKTANDSFYKTSLQSILSENNISELYITGCATDFCVDTTVKSALGRDYKVTIIEDGHTTASRPYIDAKTVINHYNWLWGDMSPTKHKITVAKTNDIKL